jgi:hypothetical protein
MSEENGLATADQIRAAGSRAIRRYKMLDPLPVNELRLRIQSLTEREMGQHDAEAISSNKAGVKLSAIENANGRMFVRCLVDAEGNRLFGDRDTALFADWDSADTRVLYDAIAEHCGIRQISDEKLVKNSETMPADETPSDSPSE